MERLTNFIEEQARRRFHEQRYQLHHQQGHGKHPQRGPAVPQEITGPGFSFVLPPPIQDYDETRIPFAVDPSDPRYYENTPSEYWNLLNIIMIECFCNIL